MDLFIATFGAGNVASYGRALVLELLSEILNGVFMERKIKGLLQLSFVVVFVALLSGCVVPVKHGVSEKKVVKVIEVKGVSKSELYSRAGDWLALAFISSPDILKNKDSERGRYIGKAVNSATITSGLTTIFVNVNFNIIIDTKDGKARIILDNYDSYHPEALAKTHDDMWKLAISFTKYMEEGGEYTADW